MSKTIDWAERVRSFGADTTLQNRVSQIRAKALMKSLHGDTTRINWAYDPRRLAQNLTASTFALEALGATDPRLLDGVRLEAKRIAIAWEALGGLEEGVSPGVAWINSALAYDLAGFTANAICLARRFSSSPGEANEGTVPHLASLFLQRLFVQINVTTLPLIQEPVLRDLDLGFLANRLAESSAALALRRAAGFLQSGRGSDLTDSAALLRDSESLLAELGRNSDANIVRGVRMLFPVVLSRSTWTLLGGVSEDPRWARYLRLLARGTKGNPLTSPSVSELWPSQAAAVAGGLFTSNSSKLVRMPTSAGKTRIAELALVHQLISRPGSKCVYVAPFRALVTELEETLLGLFSDLGFRVSSVFGTYESDDFEQVLEFDADLLVTTPEKLDLILRARPEFLARVGLFVLDEGHLIDDPKRGPKYELLLTRIRRRLPGARFLFASAVVPRETLEDFAKWFHASPANDVMTSEWRPSIQRVARFQWIEGKGDLRYEPSDDTGEQKPFVRGAIVPVEYRYRHPTTQRMRRRVFPEADDRGEAAAELGFKFAELGPVLIYCAQKPSVEAVGKLLEERLALTGWSGEVLPAFFQGDETTRSFISCREWLGLGHLVTRLVRVGVGLHHASLPEVIRERIETDFRDRRLRVLVATNTLAQGVNLPIRTVIMHSTKRHDSETDLWQAIPARDYWNIAGRAGRACEETEGTVVHLSMNPADAACLAHFLSKRSEPEPVESALFRSLNDLIAERTTPEAIQDRIDPEMIALVAEEQSLEGAEHLASSVLGETLAGVQSERHHVDTARLTAVFLASSASIRSRVPSDLIRLYSSTGLRSESCSKIRQDCITNGALIGEAIRSTGPADVQHLLSLLLPGTMAVREMATSRRAPSSIEQCLERWIAGDPIPEISRDPAASSLDVEELALYVADMFGYRLPWGLSAYLRIACQALDIESTAVSYWTKYLPAMVKFGVPNPVASWGVAAGMPSRRSAVAMSLAYEESEQDRSPPAFLAWLGGIEPGRLLKEYGVDATEVPALVRAMYRSGGNPLIAENPDITHFLPHTLSVSDLYSAEAAATFRGLRQGDSIDVVRDYGDSYDRNSISLHRGGILMGKMERRLAQLLAPEVDCGLELRGTVESLRIVRGASIASIRLEKAN